MQENQRRKGRLGRTLSAEGGVRKKLEKNSKNPVIFIKYYLIFIGKCNRVVARLGIVNAERFPAVFTGNWG